MTGKTHVFRTISEIAEVIDEQNGPEIIKAFGATMEQLLALKALDISDVTLEAINWTDDGIDEIRGAEVILADTREVNKTSVVMIRHFSQPEKGFSGLYSLGRFESADSATESARKEVEQQGGKYGAFVFNENGHLALQICMGREDVVSGPYHFEATETEASKMISEKLEELEKELDFFGPDYSSIEKKKIESWIDFLEQIEAVTRFRSSRYFEMAKAAGEYFEAIKDGVAAPEELNDPSYFALVRAEFRTKRDPKTCENCRFWERSDGKERSSDYGECAALGWRMLGAGGDSITPRKDFGCNQFQEK